MIYFIFALFSLTLGAYIYKLDTKSWINRLYMLISIAIFLWSLGIGMANLSSQASLALLWRRFAAVGWSSIFTFVLHFLLLVSGRLKAPDCKKLIIILYIPAILFVYIFAISPSMATIQYNLVKTDYGWTNIAVNNIWDFLFYAYYIIYASTSLILVLSWRSKLKDKLKNNESEFIFLTILFVVIGGSITDLFINSFISKPLPQIAPLLALIPMYTMYHAARYRGVFIKIPKSRADLIVTSHDRKQLFIYMARVFWLAGILVFLADYLPSINGAKDLYFAFIRGGSLVAIGISLSLIQKIKNEVINEKLTIIVLVAIIPIITLLYGHNASISVWAFPVVIIVSSFIFSKLTLLVLTTASAIFTQVLLLNLYPKKVVLVTNYNYYGRIGIFVFVFLAGIYINKVYVGKIKENDRQIKFQEMVAEITFDFLSFDLDNTDEKINNLLKQIGHFFNVDRVYLFLINNNNQKLIYANEWCNKGVDPVIGLIQDSPLDEFPWWINQHKNNRYVHIADVAEIPVSAKDEKEKLYIDSVKSLLSVPVKAGGKLHGFIGIDSIKVKKSWTNENIKLLETMANILSSVLAPIKTSKETEFRAYNDSLTKLANRFLFEEKVNKAINLYNTNDESLAVMFIDLDNFKTVNDTLGHRGGDNLLVQVSNRLTSQVKEAGLVARFGGDEFMIMLNRFKNEKDLEKIASKIMSIFSKDFLIGGQSFLVSASAGIAIYPSDGKNSDDLVKNADIAMYKAKEEGINHFAISSKLIKDEFETIVHLTNSLSKAVLNNEFILHYQPQVDINTKEIVGVEALLRWKHQSLGIVSPDVFIPIAEKNNLINEIGSWVLKTACLQNKTWQDMGFKPVVVAVNISANQILNNDLVSEVKNVLKETGLLAKYLELEVTESIAIRDSVNVLKNLRQLSNLGVGIAIDDFGMEYSSLNRLKQLPANMLKIDLEFTKGIETNLSDRAIIKVIISLAKNLNIKVIAEGVETVEQLEFLKHEKCDFIQGYLFYKPMLPELVSKHLELK